jgi:type II secretory pathway predicted ATPase ExeA
MRRPPGLIADAPRVAAPVAAVAAPANYLDLYGLSKPPFGQSSEAAGYILFGSHRRPFELLIDHMVNGSGMIVLYARAGTGKTEILRATGDVAAESGVPVIRVMRPPNGRVDLPMLLSALHGPDDSNLMHEMTAFPGSLSDKAMERTIFAPPRKTMLIDDLDLMPPDCAGLLLRLLQPAAEPGGIAIVATATSDISADGARPDLVELARLARNTVQLPPIGPAETRQYIERSLWMAGGTTRRLIEPDALKLIVHRSGGLPGLVNRQMEAAFTAGFARGDSRITAKTVAAIAGPAGQCFAAQRPKTPSRVFPFLALGVFAIGMAAFIYKAVSSGYPGKPPLAAVQEPAQASAPDVVQQPEPSTLTPARPVETLSPAVMTALMKRGEQSLSLGDIAAARLLFQRAAEAGNARAAVALGRTYDPDFLASGSAPGEKPDPARATEWYRKAAAMGDAQAADLLKRSGGP